MRRFLGPIVLLFFILSPLSTDADEPIKIGLSLSVTGQYAEMSDMQMKAFKLWERDVNSRGGILGRNVNIIIYDNKSDPETVKSQYEQLIREDRVDLLFAPYSSELTEAILPITEQYGFPLIASGASADSLWQKGAHHLFGLYTVASKYSAGFLEMIVRNNFERIAIVYIDDSFAQSVANGAKKWAERFGLKVVMFSGFTGVKLGNDARTDVARKARDAHSQAFLVCGHFDEAVNMRLVLKKVGWYPKAYYASVGPVLSKYQERVGTDSNLTFSTSQWEPHAKFHGSIAFYRSFVKHSGRLPSYQAATAYAAGQILEKAVKKAESLNRAKIRDMLATMNAMSIIGRYAVDKTGRQTGHQPLIIQRQRGKKEIVWPEDLRTAKPIFR